MIELYHADMSTCAQKVRLTLAEKGLPWESHLFNLRHRDQHDPDYLKLNPNGVVPTLVDRGTVIIESTVICEYLDDAYPEVPLRPSAPAERARRQEMPSISQNTAFAVPDLTDIPQVECLLLHVVAVLCPDQPSWARCAVVRASDARTERDF